MNQNNMDASKQSLTVHPMHILLVEDTPADAQVLQQALAKEKGLSFHLTHTDKLSSALAVLAEGKVDVVLLDLLLPDSEGLLTITQVVQQAPRVPIVVLTAADDEGLAVQSLQQGAQDYLVKGYVQVYPNLLGRALRYAVERKRADEELRAAYRQTEELLTSITSILIGVSPLGLITHWNTVAETTFGIPATAAVHQSLAAFNISWDRAKVAAGLSVCERIGRPTRVDDVPFRYPDGHEGVIGLTIVPLRAHGQSKMGFLIFGADVTERKQAEAERAWLHEQLVQAQKMETIGRFAGGIAHDFENFLQVILGFAWLIRSRHKDDPALLKDLDEIIHGAESASGMVRQLLAFSRRQALKPTVLEINRALEQMAKIIQQLVGEAIQVKLLLASEPLMAQLDPTAFEQVIMNLSSNARDVMRQGGSLTIRTAPTQPDAAFRTTHPTFSGDCIRLSISDTGVGMDPEVAAHIFEPFFTTKQSGHGTGLGLAVVHGLVQQHGGVIEVDTVPGRGTTFHLYLARWTPSAAQASPAPASADSATSASRKHVPVFIVESDPQQKTLIEELLRESGFSIAGASSLPDVVGQIKQKPADIKILILDHGLMGNDPAGLIKQLRQLKPAMNLLIVTGHRDEKLRLLSETLPGLQILRKPFVPSQLLSSLETLAGQVAAGAGIPEKGKVTSHKILVVDDDPAIRTFCERILSMNHAVTLAASGKEALECLKAAPQEVLVTDLKMPEMDGFHLLEEVLHHFPGVKIIIMSSLLTPLIEQQLRLSGARYGILRKPFTPDQLHQAVAQCLSSHLAVS